MSDLISRGQLFNLLAPVQTLGEAYGIIQGMEPVDAVPVRHGSWIGGEIGQCSVCGYTGCASDIWNTGDIMFCPNCGADMRKDGEAHENH